MYILETVSGGMKSKLHISGFKSAELKRFVIRSIPKNDTVTNTHNLLFNKHPRWLCDS